MGASGLRVAHPINFGGKGRFSLPNCLDVGIQVGQVASRHVFQQRADIVRNTLNQVTL
jgi:hypothetical protein